VVLLDEPSSSLDRQAEQELRQTLVEIGRDRTVIIVTHSPILLAACDDLIALDKGKIAMAATRPKVPNRDEDGVAIKENQAINRRIAVHVNPMSFDRIKEFTEAITFKAKLKKMREDEAGGGEPETSGGQSDTGELPPIVPELAPDLPPPEPLPEAQPQQ
jgi:ABC-type multidrug transport system ATPase subunit